MEQNILILDMLKDICKQWTQKLILKIFANTAPISLRPRHAPGKEQGIGRGGKDVGPAPSWRAGAGWLSADERCLAGSQLAGGSRADFDFPQYK